MQLHAGAIFRLLLLSAVVGSAFWLRSSINLLGGDTQVILVNLPYLMCLAAVFLAIQFNRCRLLLASVGVGVLYWLIQAQLQVSLSQPEAGRLYLAASLALPLLGLYLLLLPETGIRNLRGIMAALVFVLLALACVQIAAWLLQGGGSLEYYYQPRPVEGYVLSRGATGLTAVVLLVGVILSIVRNDNADIALLGIIGALYLVLAQLHLDNVSVVMCSVAGACLLWGLVLSSHAMAYRDDLTGMLGRRALNERLRGLGRNYCIAMLDVDHFKRFNDTHGHDVGDEVLKMVSSRICQVGNGGTAYRYGGEEFCVVFPRKPIEECAEALEAVRERIADYSLSIRDRDKRPSRAREGARRRGATRLGRSHVAVTVSVGIAASGEDYPSPDDVISAADGNLYRAKKKGRNRLIY
jgi:diguanylate cyclase (GGDEF)-like protein